MLQRRTLALSAAALAALTLAACGKKEEPKKAETPVAPAAAKVEATKVAFVYLGPAGDHGWTYAHDLGRKDIDAEFKDKVSTSVVEKVPETADAERVIRDLATQGNKVIFATSFGYMEPMLKVAKEFPNVKFEHATGYKTTDNMRVYQVKMYETAYLAGVVAGKTTKSNVLGFVGSIGIPEVARNLNAFQLGAASVNPKVKTKVLWVGEWFNPGKEKEAALTLINQGADVLIQNTDSTAVVQTAEEKGKFAFGWDSDMSKFAPKAHLASSIINWGPYYKQAVKEAMDGTWKTGSDLRGLKEGAVDLVAISDTLPAATKEAVAKAKAALIDGSLVVFKDDKGVALDQKTLDGMNFLVKGVDGKIPQMGK
jgi:basic membrane protein A and related proteins